MMSPVKSTAASRKWPLRVSQCFLLFFADQCLTTSFQQKDHLLNPSFCGAGSTSHWLVMFGSSFSERLSLSESSSGKNALPLITMRAKLSPRKRKAKPTSFPKLTQSKSMRSNSNASRTYRYKIMPGNNSRVIMMTLKKRPWWHANLGAEDATQAQAASFIWEMYRNSKRYADSSHEHVMINHIQKNSCLVTKKGLYLCLRNYCAANNIDLLKIIPRTFYLASGAGSKSIKDDDLDSFMQFNEDMASTTGANNDNNSSSSSSSSSSSNSSQTHSEIQTIMSKTETVWIMKPASKTNRGFGIKVIRGLDNVLSIVNRTSSRAASRESVNSDTAAAGGGGGGGMVENESNPLTKAARRAALQDGWIVQLYMDRPLLVSGRKFDIRCFVLVTHSVRKGLKGYFYRDAYVRTSSKKYSMDKISDRETHLTNDAVQKLSKAYGKFENGNKLNFDEWQALINVEYPHAPENVVFAHIFPEIKRLSKLSLEAAAETLSKTVVQKSFELFGYDYMVDEHFNPVLIEVNTNPCLEFACPLLETLISELIENTIRVAVDPEFPPPAVNRTKATEEGIELIQSAEMKFEALYP